ncbi:MAG: hypothetical protein R2909_07660 [Gemmatimonadales bacterium]
MTWLDSDASRRRFLASGALALSASALRAPSIAALRRSAVGGADRWLDRLDGEERQLFDFPDPRDAVPLGHILHFYDTYNEVYGIEDRKLNAVGTFYGKTIPFAFADRSWARFRLGELLEVPDPETGRPAERNPWRITPHVRGVPTERAGIEALQARGVIFLACQAAVRSLAGKISARDGAPIAGLVSALETSLLPGVELVPSMVIAIQRAQRRGLSYYRL